MDLTEKLISHLDKLGVSYKFFEHDPTPTSDDSARVRGSDISCGAKAIILRTKKSGENIMVVLPGDRKIDIAKVRKFVGEDVNFEDKGVILNKYKVMVGGVPPFGELMGMRTLIDSNVFNNSVVDFNAGKQTCSIEMSTEDFRIASKGLIDIWSKYDI